MFLFFNALIYRQYVVDTCIVDIECFYFMIITQLNICELALCCPLAMFVDIPTCRLVIRNRLGLSCFRPCYRSLPSFSSVGIARSYSIIELFFAVSIWSSLWICLLHGIYL